MFFTEPPVNFSPQFTVVACAIEHNGKLLVIQRATGSYAGYWGLPAGKREGSETVSETAVREILEEIAVAIDPSQLTSALSRATRYPEFDFWFHMLRITLDERPTIQPNPREVADLRWLTPIETLRLRYLPNFDDQLHVLYPKLLTS